MIISIRSTIIYLYRLRFEVAYLNVVASSKAIIVILFLRFYERIGHKSTNCMNEEKYYNTYIYRQNHWLYLT